MSRKPASSLQGLPSVASRAEIEQGKSSFASLEGYMLKKGEITANQSGRQEMLENLINMYL